MYSVHYALEVALLFLLFLTQVSRLYPTNPDKEWPSISSFFWINSNAIIIYTYLSWTSKNPISHEWLIFIDVAFIVPLSKSYTIYKNVTIYGFKIYVNQLVLC